MNQITAAVGTLNDSVSSKLALDTESNERSSRLRMQSVEADHEAIASESTARTLAPGAKLKPYDVAHPEYEFDTAVVQSVYHHAQDTTYETGSGEPSYANSFTALPGRLPATPHRSNHRPRIEGSQIAIIAGPEGEEIHTDQYGRVKLWFPWDRRAKKDGSDTKWVRVGQPWAGGTWGAQTIPRIGMEAVISYQDGDPDKPIVTALVSNPQQKVPYDLPLNKTRMVLRSNTHKGTGFNEFSMEDESGSEEIFTHAQRDMNTHVLNDKSLRTDHNEARFVGNNSSEEISNNKFLSVGSSLNISVGMKGFSSFGGYEIGGMFQPLKTMAASLSNEFFDTLGAGSLTTQVSGADRKIVGGSSSETIANNKTITAGGQIEVSARSTVEINAKEDILVSSRGHTSVLSGDMFEVYVGSTSITMSSDGSVKVKAKDIEFVAENEFVVKAAKIRLN